MPSSPSIFARPASPPPRIPSPTLESASLPLPLPHRRRPHHLQLHHAKSFDTLERTNSDNVRAKVVRKTASKGILKPSPPPTPQTNSTHSLPTPSYPRLSPRLTLSCAVPYRSPPASPTLASPPPPVPPIPAFVLTQPTLKAQDGVLPVSPISPTISRHSESAPSSNSSTQRRNKSCVSSNSEGMTCSRFLSIHNSHSRSAAVVV
ncbi:hypothetical protein Moror_8040 [Moniliophthora roreri MCA 2997]|uniref:Uncharacterized protein n=1 Tax=Moniliophthora roreri (strain MCA 2997) TaxID=1381753 RepID=V2XL79_MONRO|nr:hypothetical protein Moror_8040 [Moniliophthora roreri MCA 2997]